MNPHLTHYFVRPVVWAGLMGLLAGHALAEQAPASQPGEFFRRVATFPVFKNSRAGATTSAEIVAATKDGKTLVYTDGQLGRLGLVDISRPSRPQPAGTIRLTGDPTSVAISGRHLLAAVVTDGTFTNPAGVIEVFRLGDRKRVALIPVGGQPDSIAISPDGHYAAVVIENQRDEESGDGRPGQPGNPPGRLVIIDLDGKPSTWTTREVSLTGLANRFGKDPEPEFVDINQRNIAAVTMQENNHIALVDLASGKVINDFPAGSTKVRGIDATEDGLIDQTETTVRLPREPDAIAWLDDKTFGTANEGDLDGGTRGFTFFDTKGNVLFDSKNGDDQLLAQVGHYPESRSENKGNEPEAIEYAKFGKDRLVFIGSERASTVSVYRLTKSGKPNFLQVLPTGLGPEGVLAIPQRNLLVVASENDSRDDNYRGTITIYQRKFRSPNYPRIISKDRKNGSPIPWAALSALSADPETDHRVWTVEDSYFKKTRILRMNTASFPAVIDREIRLSDADGVFLQAINQAAKTYNNKRFVNIAAAELINDDKTINLDAEGLARSADGGFWIASEGSGTVFSARENGETSELVTSLNWLLKVDARGVVKQVVSLPPATNQRQRRFGFEGIAITGAAGAEKLTVCFQREWGEDAASAPHALGADPTNHVRIGQYDTVSGEWSFFYYPLQKPVSPAGGWVGLSEIVAIAEDEFAVIERDNKAGNDARIKRIYSFSTNGITPLPEAPIGDTPAFPVVKKKLRKNLLPLLASTKGALLEKVEGLAIFPNGSSMIVTDNDGVEDSTGETQLLRTGKIRQ